MLLFSSLHLLSQADSSANPFLNCAAKELYRASQNKQISLICFNSLSVTAAEAFLDSCAE